MLSPSLNPARNTAPATRIHTGHTGRTAAVRAVAPIQVIRAITYTSGGYARGTLVKMSPRLKNQSEIENDSSARRSRLRSESGRRRSASPSKKTAQSPSQTSGLLMSFPPNAPGPPRAIFHATCGPVHASETRPVRSSTRPSAICPASPHQTRTCHALRSSSYSACTVRSVRG